jgi:hypothetical protein
MPDVKWLEDYKRMRAFEEQIKKSLEAPPAGGPTGAA